MQRLMNKGDLTQGSVVKGLLLFALPIFLGQLLQQLYHLADAWVIGNFAGNNSFAAVSSGNALTWLIIGFFSGVSIGGGVIISRYFGAKEEENIEKAIQNNFLFGLIASVLATTVGLLITPQLLVWMQTPEEVMPYSLTYFTVYFGGVSTIIMYNFCMSIMRALGDSVHPLYYLVVSSVANVVLDLLFVAVFKWDVAGAAIATVISQGLSVVLCLIQMLKEKKTYHLDLKALRLDKGIMKEILVQGLPTGVQNAVISVGNLVIQGNINAFGAFAMAGHGAYSKIEGFVFLPITCLSMALPTFVSQNLGAKKYDRAKKGAAFGTICAMVLAEAVGMILLVVGKQALGFFVDTAESIVYGQIDIGIVAPFFFLLSFSHCAAGVMRGCGKSTVPMVTMLAFWCGLRIVYVTTAVYLNPVYQMISWAYPLTWACSSAVFALFLLRSDWVHAFDR